MLDLLPYDTFPLLEILASISACVSVYFYGNKKRLRNTKILKLLTIIKKNNFKFYNIRSMILKNDNNLLVFSAKK